MAATLWDSFEDILNKAENYFLNFQFSEAMKAWENYYAITAKTEYQSFANEIAEQWDDRVYSDINSLSQLYIILSDLQIKHTKKEISQYTFELYKRLLIRIYQKRFREGQENTDLVESGVFEFLSGNAQTASVILQKILDDDPGNIQARIYLGFAMLDLHEQKTAIELLTENLFLAADKIPEDALYLSQFKLLYGKLFSDSGNREEAAWLLAFESWFRSYLVFKEDKEVYRLIRQLESNERIMQVKYYAHERYRHFARCLFVAEYTRQFHKQEHGLIQEQELYMQKLDRQLFSRYRKKRREI